MLLSMKKNQLRNFFDNFVEFVQEALEKKMFICLFQFYYYLPFEKNMLFHVNPNEILPVKNAESAYFDCEEL